MAYFFSQYLLHERVFFKFLHCFQKIGGQAFDALCCQLFRRHLMDIPLHGFGRFDFILNAVKSCGQTDCQCQIRIAGWIRGTEFDSGLLPAGCRNTNQRRPVFAGPCNVGGGFVAWHEALIGIDQRI